MSGNALKSTVSISNVVPTRHQLLRHIDPRHASARPDQFAEGVAVPAGAAAEVQDSAASELRREGKAAAEESGGWEELRVYINKNNITMLWWGIQGDNTTVQKFGVT